MKHPRQNRVTPFGTIEATLHRGMLMGNRGDLHAADGTLERSWKSQRWISCILDGGGWRAPMDAPGHNYPLFFHDEAVALAAGHRPCGQCRLAALENFIAAWKMGHSIPTDARLSLPEINRHLHIARLAEQKSRVAVEIETMPDGTFVWCPDIDPRPLLVSDGFLVPWSHKGYDQGARRHHLSHVGQAYQLTPTPLVAVLRGGYRPLITLDTPSNARG